MTEGRNRGQVPVSHICDETGMKQVPVPVFLALR